MPTTVYGRVERVESLVGDLVDGRTFDDDTVPSVGEVEQFLEERAATLNMALRRSGYTVPVTDTETLKWLEYINAVGAAIIVISTLPLAGYADPSFDSPSVSRRHAFEKEWKDAFKMISDGVLPAAKTLSDMHEAYSGARLDSSGSVKNPMFKRDMLRHPSAPAETGT